MKFRDVCIIRIMDILAALALLPAALLIFVLLLLPQLAVFGKIFYLSRRIGREGKPFTYVKLKSMRDQETPVPSGGGRAHLEAKRIPPWGRFLRKLHIDEIPDILLILIGTESFVGPRPLLAEHAALVDSPERRNLKPGWTGLSQVFLKRRKILPSRIQRRLDKRLGRELCPALYCRILFATAASPSRRGGMKPGPTVRAYRNSLADSEESERDTK
ncbi:MAG: sugar transferase [Treponema sp.]|jgi:lipopolysaccharide/colanic/teichoic acid biosynthesis glycosyltransferase|nr:sugar transferase [Treponema sp.]